MVCFMWGGTKNFCISRELWRLEISAVEEHVLGAGVGAGVGIDLCADQSVSR